MAKRLHRMKVCIANQIYRRGAVIACEGVNMNIEVKWWMPNRVYDWAYRVMMEEFWSRAFDNSLVENGQESSGNGPNPNENGQ